MNEYKNDKAINNAVIVAAAVFFFINWLTNAYKML